MGFRVLGFLQREEAFDLCRNLAMGITAGKTLEAIEEPSNSETPSTSSVETEPKTHEDQNPEVLDQSDDTRNIEDAEGGEEEEEEEGECGFCLFMKEGGCRESFIDWEKCVEEGEKNKEDIVEKCYEITGLLKKCMDVHADYYDPILKAEKAMEEEADKELKREVAESKEKQEDEANKELERVVAESKEKHEN